MKGKYYQAHPHNNSLKVLYTIGTQGGLPWSCPSKLCKTPTMREQLPHNTNMQLVTMRSASLDRQILNFNQIWLTENNVRRGAIS